MRFAFAFALGLLPLPVLAQGNCRLVGSAVSPELECVDNPECATSDECGGSFEPACVPGIGCIPRCGTLRACEGDTDCITTGMTVGACIVVESSVEPLAGESFCEGLSMTFCGAPGVSTVSQRQFLACMTLPFSDTLAPSWGDGDCDRDGCPNGTDAGPCDAALSACDFAGTPEALFCRDRLVAVGPEQCVFDAGELTCATAHDCDPTTPCPAGFFCNDSTHACEATECTTLYSCRSAEDCGLAGLGAAICLPAPEFFGRTRGGDGFCLFSSFRIGAGCEMRAPQCFTRPNGTPTLDVLAGDCDEDECPNGIDATPCAAGGACGPATVSSTCGTPLVPPPGDAGVFEDAGVVDAAGFDGGPPIDAPGGPRVTFAGGSGCRCQVGPSSPSPFAALSLIGLALAVIRRRR